MNKHFYLVSLLMVAGLTACSSSDDEPTPPPTPERKITIEVSENPLIDDSADGARSTRGAIITTASLLSFNMNYQESKYTATKSETTGWSAMPSGWPNDVGNDDKIVFYAYNGGTYNYNSGNPYISFEMEEAADSQKDLLVAQTEVAYNDEKGKVRLTFDHACAAVDFKFQITNTLHTKLDGDLTVSSLILRNVIKTGDYYYSTKSWSSLGAKSNYTLTSSSKTITTTASTVTDTGTMFIIPQTLGSDACMEITYGGKTATVSLAGATWEAGKHYDVTIRLGTTTIN